VLGAVGQPRDGDNAACYAMFDQRTLEITYHRVAYDIETAAEKIRAAGLAAGSRRPPDAGPLTMAKPRLETGSTLVGFLIGEVLHTGGMAMLWKVTRPDLDGPLVMKVPLLFEGEDPSAIVSFEMEQMIMPRLSGPHVPKFIAAGDFTVQPYIVMEYLEGQPLLKRLKEVPLPYDEVVRIATRVATALDDIHRQNVIHLDVKPSNIMFRPTGEAVLIDFGLAHHTQLPDLMDEEFRLPYGTAPYMAPEQILGTRRDPRSDIFALGVLIYFLSTGVRPFGDPQTLKG